MVLPGNAKEALKTPGHGDSQLRVTRTRWKANPGGANGNDNAISKRQTTCDYPGGTKPKFKTDFQRDGILRVTKVAAVAGRLRGRPRDSPDCPFGAPNRDWTGCGPVWYCDRAALNGLSVTRSFFSQKTRCARAPGATIEPYISKETQ